MRALTVVPLKADTAALTDVAEPPESDAPVLVETLAVGQQALQRQPDDVKFVVEVNAL